jgi:adenosylhomocysteine nucleosidase
MPFADRRPGVADILYVMATELEYGPELKSRITPLITGVGPIEAAIVLTEHLTRLSADDRLPLLVVSLGSAGSAELEQCGLYQASEVSWRDMDASAIGFAPGVVPFLDLPATLKLGPFVPGIAMATLSTGANVVSGSAYDGIVE